MIQFCASCRAEQTTGVFLLRSFLVVVVDAETAML